MKFKIVLTLENGLTWQCPEEFSTKKAAIAAAQSKKKTGFTNSKGVKFSKIPNHNVVSFEVVAL